MAWLLVAIIFNTDLYEAVCMSLFFFSLLHIKLSFENLYIVEVRMQSTKHGADKKMKDGGCKCKTKLLGCSAKHPCHLSFLHFSFVCMYVCMESHKG